MAGTPLEAWIEPLIKSEIGAVLQWKTDLRKYPLIKEDPGSRFADDGSNFRSTVTSLTDNQGAVQILKVLSIKDNVTVHLSDGETLVKARLSDNAMDAFEAGAGEALELDTVGDVVRLKDITVVSTPYGPPEGFVQLLVEDLHYRFHLRKPFGKPVPIEHCADIRTLLDDVARLRSQQFEFENDLPVSPSVASQHADDDLPTADHVDDINKNSNIHRGTGEVNMPSSPPKPPDFWARALSGVATQFAGRSQAMPPSLDREGFEIETGVNLDRPRPANMVRPGRSVAGVPMSRGLAGGQPLLDLFNSRRPPEPAITDANRYETRTDLAYETQPVGKDPSMRSESPPPPSLSPQSRKARASAKDRVTASPDLPAPSPTAASAQAVKGSITAYGRKKIPKAQQALLDHPSSWLPPLPGKQFPQPNVPIELLKLWNDAASRQADVKASSGLEKPSLSRLSSDISSQTSDESSDEEISTSQWPPTPPPKKPDLPPDSSFDDSRDDTPSPGELEISAPRPLPIRKSPSKLPPARAQPSPRENHQRASAMATSISKPRVAQSPEDGRFERAQPNPQSKQTYSVTRASQEQTTGHDSTRDFQQQAVLSSQIAALRQQEHTAPRSRLSSPRTPSVQVPTTQLPTEQSPTPTSIPRAKPDPAEQHLQRKHAFFKAARQRRDWLRETYAPEPLSKIHLATVLSMYRRSHPDDGSATAEEFLNVAKDIFPSFRITPETTFRRRANPPGWQSSPSQATLNLSTPSNAQSPPSRPATTKATNDRSPASSNRPPTSGQRSPPSVVVGGGGNGDQNSRSRQPKEGDESRENISHGPPEATEEGLSAFDEFYRGYRKLKIFQSDQREDAERMDVLSWKL